MPDLQAIHLSSEQLMASDSRPLVSHLLFRASCHRLKELKHVEALDAGFIFLSPILAAASFHDSQLLDGDGFKEMACQVNIPVHALGGMTPDHMAASKK